MRFLSIVGCLTWLTIFVPGSVYAQNTVPEDEKGPSHLQQDKPPLRVNETFVHFVRCYGMGERQAARLFGWSLGGVFLTILALNALAR